MKRILNGLYTFQEKGDKAGATLRMWHDCKKYRDRDTARVELLRSKDDQNVFVCPYCGFEFKIE
jgi:hypothetical protein